MVFLGQTSLHQDRFGADKGIIGKARELRKRMTPAELALWSVIRKKQLSGLRFRRQHPIGHYIADFYCLEIKLVVEVDGGSHIGKEEYDEIRQQTITDHGLIILRFSNDDVLERINYVKHKIISAAYDIRTQVKK